jgi:hypothetical protein
LVLFIYFFSLFCNFNHVDLPPALEFESCPARTIFCLLAHLILFCHINLALARTQATKKLSIEFRLYGNNIRILEYLNRLNLISSLIGCYIVWLDLMMAYIVTNTPSHRYQVAVIEIREIRR